MNPKRILIRIGFLIGILVLALAVAGARRRRLLENGGASDDANDR